MWVAAALAAACVVAWVVTGGGLETAARGRALRRVRTGERVRAPPRCASGPGEPVFAPAAIPTASAAAASAATAATRLRAPRADSGQAGAKLAGAAAGGRLAAASERLVDRLDELVRRVAKRSSGCLAIPRASTGSSLAGSAGLRRLARGGTSSTC